MVVFSLCLCDGLLVLNGYRGGTALPDDLRHDCHLFVEVLPFWLPLRCGFIGGLLQPRCLILITFRLISVPPSPLYCCFWPTFTGSDLAEMYSVQKMPYFVPFHLRKTKLFDRASLFSWFPSLYVCVSAHMEVVEFTLTTNWCPVLPLLADSHSLPGVHPQG